MHIHVRINEEGALRNQRFAFSDKFTLISELLQNARRAGASRIQVRYDESRKYLRVADDGAGIDDFQKLLTFNESGWDARTRDQENPFGIGFSKCLYSATRCVVASRGQRVDFETAAALSKAEIEVTPALAVDVDGGPSSTVVELHGVELPGLEQRIASMCLGFPVAVDFNGALLDRPFAAENLSLTLTSVGHVFLTGVSDGKHHHDTLVFLQGFCVMRPSYPQMDRVNVVHLDPREFVARLPDRDKLIDEEDQRKRINAALQARWRQVLVAAKAELGAAQFVDTYYAAMRSWGHLELLNDIDVLPPETCEQIVGYPCQQRSGERDYLGAMTAAPSRQAIESGDVKLVALDPVSEDNAALWMFAQARGHVVFNSMGLDHGHWVQRHVRRYPDHQLLRVQAIDAQTPSALDGRWVWPVVVLCEAVRLHLGNDVADIGDAGVFHRGILYIPAGESSGEPVRQVSDFMDGNDRFMSSDLEADRDALADLIRHLRCVDPQDTLGSLLHELKLEQYPLLRGRTFRLTVGAIPLGHTVELMD